jgi:hypothetical protein
MTPVILKIAAEILRKAQSHGLCSCGERGFQGLVLFAYDSPDPATTHGSFTLPIWDYGRLLADPPGCGAG